MLPEEDSNHLELMLLSCSLASLLSIQVSLFKRAYGVDHFGVVFPFLFLLDCFLPLFSQHISRLLHLVSRVSLLLAFEVVELVFHVNVVGIDQVQAGLNKSDVERMVANPSFWLFLLLHRHCLLYRLLLWLDIVRRLYRLFYRSSCLSDFAGNFIVWVSHQSVAVLHDFLPSFRDFFLDHRFLLH